MKLIMLLTLTLLSSCSDNRETLEVECYDSSGDLIHKGQTKDVYISSLSKDSVPRFMVCVIATEGML